MCLEIEVLASLKVILPKKWVGRAMGNEALNLDGLNCNLKEIFLRDKNIKMR